MEDSDWKMLLCRIKDGKCTPFLGAGVNFGILPLGAEVARALAKDFRYPMDDSSDLARVAQYLAVVNDPMFPKEEILKMLGKQVQEWEKRVPQEKFFSSREEILSVLAALPFPIYVTTNYDDLLVRALRICRKDPKRELCRWNKYVREEPSVFDSPAGFEPSTANPVVFHLHGHDQVPESLVLSEDDYLDFLVNAARQQDLIPPRIKRALTGSSLLFVGYRLADWDFRVVFKGLVESLEGSLRRMNVSVQLPPQCEREDSRLEQQSYLARYFGNMKVQVYWGTAQEFARELKERWEAYEHG
ncbi:MAG: SIR2 family protein [Syntrophobacteraceae bacterium]|nr:SIR2 family protein [Syntrophobacteraceae bacterium]